MHREPRVFLSPEKLLPHRFLQGHSRLESEIQALTLSGSTDSFFIKNQIGILNHCDPEKNKIVNKIAFSFLSEVQTWTTTLVLKIRFPISDFEIV